MIDYANRIMSKVNDEVEQAFRQGYTTGFNEGMQHACIIKSDNERLKRENAFLNDMKKLLRELQPVLRAAFFANYKDQNKADELYSRIAQIVGRE